MIRDQQLTPEEVIQSFQSAFPKDVSNTRIERHTVGMKKIELQHLWLRVSRNAFKDVVSHLFTFDEQPHFVVTSGYDIDNTIDLVYHFSIYHGFRHKEQSINITVSLPKSDPTIDTITDLFPGALISEQEKQEMLGVKVNNIPVDKRVFISEDFPKNVYPWRRDEGVPEQYAKNLHKEKQ
jgi:membrane-bound hydrogenase subunit beta